MSVKVYGIKNCNTMKKTFQLLEKEGVSFEFVDYKKEKPDIALLEGFTDRVGLDQLVNRKGTTFRKLSDAQKASLDHKESAFPLLAENSSMIKRPILQFPDGDLILGFQEDEILQRVSKD